MLLYLDVHLLPDIVYSVNCIARYMSSPKHSHELAINTIYQYLKAARDRGLRPNKSQNLKNYCYTDVDFYEMYGNDKATDSACVNTRTVYAITDANLPVIWQSKLQTEIDLSTMEAEIIAMYHIYKELFTIMDKPDILGQSVGLPVRYATKNVPMHKENVNKLVLAKAL